VKTARSVQKCVDKCVKQQHLNYTARRRMRVITGRKLCMVEISKSDWKLFRERLPEWQEHYMERLTKEYIELLSSPGNASDHFWELEERIKKDKKNPGVLLELRKSEVLWDMAAFVRRKIITMDELEGFSEELIEAVQLILSR
jgi:hypothetical protein